MESCGWDPSLEPTYDLEIELDDLIEALTILRKYGNPKYPTTCEHDILYVCIDAKLVSAEDTARLDELGFFVENEADGFASHHFGNC
jgi:hypothetical protein